MTTFIGFNTQGQFKKFTLTDFELAKRDLLNAFNIQQGQLPGRPDYGTTIWEYLFENQVAPVQEGIINEVQRVAGGDPRIVIDNVNVFPQENGILIEIALEYVGAPDSQVLSIFFDQQIRNASYV